MMADSYRDAGLLRRVVRQTVATRPGAWVCARLLHRIDHVVFRASRGRTTFSTVTSGLPVVMLTTTGARTGQPRTMPVLAFQDGGRMVVIASNYGQRHNPAWYYNLRADGHADVRVGSRSVAMTARELAGAERERYFQRGLDIYPGWAQYRRRASHRDIPVIMLEPTSDEGDGAK
jgi:deazaflavin-dependent oxidoreductase (nitroreductase family)